LALLSNPLGELTGPLHRVETAVTRLSEELGALDVLPGVREALTETNVRLNRVEETRLARIAGEGAVDALEAIRAELAEVGRLLCAGAARSTGVDGAEPGIATAPSVAVRPRG